MWQLGVPGVERGYLFRHVGWHDSVQGQLPAVNLRFRLSSVMVRVLCCNRMLVAKAKFAPCSDMLYMAQGKGHLHVITRGGQISLFFFNMK